MRRCTPRCRPSSTRAMTPGRRSTPRCTPRCTPLSTRAATRWRARPSPSESALTTPRATRSSRPTSRTASASGRGTIGPRTLLQRHPGHQVCSGGSRYSKAQTSDARGLVAPKLQFARTPGQNEGVRRRPPGGKLVHRARPQERRRQVGEARVCGHCRPRGLQLLSRLVPWMHAQLHQAHCNKVINDDTKEVA